MKTILSLSMCLLWLQTAYCQEYLKLLTDEKVWNVQEVFSTNSSLTQSIKFEYDTIINGENYWRQYITYDSINPFQPINFFLREDTSSQKVYYYSTEENLEIVLYDFSLVVGDTIELNNDGCVIESVVVSTESDFFLGISRKIINLASIDPNEGVNERWIEGIGSTSGIVHTIKNQCSPSGFTRLLCVYHLDQLLYNNPEVNQCYISTLAINDRETNADIEIFPNPVINNTVSFRMPETGLKYQVRIWDSLGNLCYSEEHDCYTDELTINIENLSPGPHIAMVNGNTSGRWTNQLIVL